MLAKVDRPFLITVVLLVVVGFFIFTSASLGLFAREGARFSSVAFSQIVFGIIGGTMALLVASSIKFAFWKKHAFHFFVGAIALSLLVFVPGIGFEYGGARRWIDLGVTTFQPAELLKLAYVVYLASWLSQVRNKITDWKYGLGPFLGITALTGALLLAQPDTGTFVVIFAAGVAMFIAAGASLRDLAVLVLIGILGLVILAFARPYVMDRIVSFVDPSSDPLGSSYQIQQSLIAVGSGEFFGRGFGQSVQKFNYLPEPIGDSVFSVAAEEFGFVGSALIIMLFLFLALRGLRIATHAPNYFGGLLVVGIVILIIAQSFVNIGSMLGILPLTGLPLLFVSHGGTAMLVALLGIGIILSVSKYQR